MRTLGFSGMVICCLAAACSGQKAGDSEPQPHASGATIIRSTEISGSVLQALRTKIPSVRISTATGCPQIAFRGSLSASNQPQPTVYINGTLLADTCALTTVSANEIERIEVYTSGQTPYANIRRNPAGVIIVYQKRE
jgi:hypothetical protein